MSNQIKILLCLLPYLLAGFMVYSLLYPAFLEEQSKSQDLQHHKKDLEELDTKLKACTKAEAEKTSLESAIRSLREAVPKTPEVDLLLVDLERMCSESGVDLLAVESPDAEAIKAMKGDDTKNKPAVNSIATKKANPKLAKDKAAAPPEELNPLRQLNKQIYVAGSYGQIVNFMKKLEIYKRVVSISYLSISSPQDEGGPSDPAANRAKRLNLKEPVLSFILTLYYLP